MSNLLAHKSVGIKKSTRGHQLKDGEAMRPDYVLVDRNQQWKHVTKSLLSYYQGLSQIESHTAKSTLALCETIQVPFHEGHQFLGDDGWQQVLYDVRDDTKLLAEHHQSLHETIEKTVINELHGLRAEIKSHIVAIEKEAGSLADNVDRERQHSTNALTVLSQGIDTFENDSTAMLPQHDPFITHHQAHSQLTKQVHMENDLQRALIRFQQQQPEFEATIVKNLQSAVTLFDEAKAAKQKEIEAVEAKISAALHRVTPEAEYEFFKTREGAVIDPNSPQRNAEAVTFPGFKHGSTIPIKQGYLERKKRFTKSYKESYYSLTPSGYLHERKTNDPANTTAPTFSLFLPECTLSSPSKESDKSHKFSIEGNKAHRSSSETKVKNVLRFGGKEIAYTFRARTHAEMLSWWTALDKLSRDTESPAPAARAPQLTNIDHAVRNIGYAEATPETTTVHQAQGSLPADKNNDAIAAAVSGAGHTTTATTNETPAENAATAHAALPSPAAVEEIDDEEETGGSSAEEEDDFDAARTKPSGLAPPIGQTTGNTTTLTGGEPSLESAGAPGKDHIAESQVDSAKNADIVNSESLPGYVQGEAKVPGEKTAALPEKWTDREPAITQDREASTSGSA